MLLISLNLSAQELEQRVVVTDSVAVGSYLPTGGTIYAWSIATPARIVYVDNEGDEYLSMVLRGVDRKGRYKKDGYLVNLDAKTGQVNWHKELKYFSVGFTKDYFTFYTAGDTRVFDKKSGKFLRAIFGEYSLINREKNFGLNKVARYIDLATGETKWVRRINSDGGIWEEVKMVGDSIMYISAKGVHKVRMSDGEGWSYKMKTTYSDPSAAIATGLMAGVMFGAIGGAIVGATGSNSAYSGFSSNILLDTVTRDVYFSAIKELVKLNDQGDTEWEVPLGRKESSMAILLDRGDRIIHINKGMVYYNGIEAWAGVPYVAAYEKTSGKEIYKQQFPRGGMRLTVLTEDTLVTRITNKLYKFDFVNGVLLDTVVDERSRGYRAIDATEYYQESPGGGIFPLTAKYPGHVIVEDDTVSITVLTRNLERERSFAKEELWTLVDTFRDLEILRRKDDVNILQKGKTIGQLKLSGKVEIVGNTLQVIDKNTMYLINLEALD